MAIVESPAVFLADFGEAVTVGGVSGSALLELEPADALGISGRRTRLRVAAAHFPAIAIDQAVVFRSNNYTVKSTPEPVPPDGAWLLVDLERA